MLMAFLDQAMKGEPLKGFEGENKVNHYGHSQSMGHPKNTNVSGPTGGINFATSFTLPKSELKKFSISSSNASTQTNNWGWDKYVPSLFFFLLVYSRGLFDT